MEKIVRTTHIIDAEGKILGRLATDVVRLLQGKQKRDYSPATDMGDMVVIKNASKINVSGKKAEQKVYRHHTLHPGGLKERPFKRVFAANPTEVIHLAIIKMLPKNRLRDVRLKRLKITP
ncbi:MAG: 50S ribosomal protein L13 [Patescibacteria group bacterium]